MPSFKNPSLIKSLFAAILLCSQMSGYGQTSEADSILKVGAALCESGALPEGIQELEKSIAIAEKKEVWDVFAEATTYKWYAVYQMTGNADTSIAALKTTLATMKEKAPDSTDILANIHLFIGYFHYYVEELEESMAESERALELFERNKENNLYDISALYNNLGVLYSNFGDVDKAEDYIKKAIALRTSFEQSGKPYDKDNHLTNYLNLASLYYSSSRYDEYLTYLNKLQDELNELGEDASALIQYKLNKQFLKYYIRKGKDLKKARAYIDLCLDLETQFPADGFDRVGTKQLTGEYYEKYGDTVLAEQYFLKGTEEFISWAGKNVHLTHEFIINLTEFYIRVGQFGKAKEWSSRNLDTFYAYKGKNISQMNLPSLQIYAALLGTETCLHYFDKNGDPAIRGQKIDQFGEKYMETLRAYASRVEKIKSLDAYLDFETVLTAMILRKQQDFKNDDLAFFQAMELLELKQALPILKNRKDINLMKIGGVPVSTQQSLKQINIQLEKTRAQYHPNNPPEVNNRLALKLGVLGQQKDSIKQQIQEQLSSKDISFQDPLDTRVKRDELSKWVGPNECLLQFFNDRKELFVLAYTKDQKMFYMEDKPDLYSNLEKLRSLLIAPENFIPEDFDTLASNLYGDLIEPLSAIIGDKNLVIMPTGTFNYIPFEVLRSKSGKYLIEEKAIRYVYSVNNSYNTSKKAKGNPIAFAPDFSSEREFGYAVRSGYEALEGAKKELQSISNYVNFSTYTQTDANKQAFLKAASESSIIHLATHAVVDESRPLRSYVVFDGADSLENDQRHLYAYELYQMNLNADLAVLSACNTGMGKISTFDGVISLAKAFENAGVHSTVMSLWPAQDESTAQIMASFYKYLAEGKTKSNALRLAKIDYLNSSSGVRKGPFFWASFIVQGDNSPIPQKNRSYWWVAIVVGLLGLGYFAFSKVKSKA
jgi:CHAT domain-containing protein/tetratricopeptide (TPR) repeat protein/lipid-A-disaccharide synthase-like uncharacterized protein